MITLQARKLIKTIDSEPEVLDKVDIKNVFSPIHRQILHFAKVLREHKQPITKPYLKDAIEKNMKKWRMEALAEIDDIHENDYWIGGDINALLKYEYNDNVFIGIDRIIKNTEYEHDQKIKKIEKLVSGASDDYETVEVRDIINKLVEFAENPETGEVIKRYRLTSNNLIKIFGEYIYSSPYLIAGRPGDYKTSLLIELVSHLNQLGLHGLHFSLEDSKYIFGVKYGAIQHSIEKNDIFQNTISESKLKHMKTVKPDGKTYVYDRGIDKDDFKRTIKDHIRRYGIEFVTLDYVQLVRTSGMSKHEGLSEFSYAVMEVCKEHQIPVIMTAQLNRDNEGYKPRLGNIKDCGSLEQDARYLFALWNERENSRNDRRHLSILKDSTRGINDLTIEFYSQIGYILNVYNFDGSKDVSKWTKK